MHNRPGLEIALIEKIQKKDLHAVNTLIDLIRVDDEAKLDSLDGNGKSLFYYALEIGFKEAVDRLLNLQLDNDVIIFGKNNKTNETCLYIAAKQGYEDTVAAIITQAKRAKPNTPGYKIWLQVNNKGNSPLHIAAANRKLNIVKLLLDEIKTNVDGISQVNRMNENDDTPLHLACSRHDYLCDDDVIVNLIQHGADLTIENTKKITPFKLLRQFDFPELATIFSKLSRKQELFLLHYSDYLKKNPDNNEIIIENYRNLICFRNLQIYDSAQYHYLEKISVSSLDLLTNINEKKLVDKPIPLDLIEGGELDHLAESSETSSWDSATEYSDSQEEFKTYLYYIKDKALVANAIQKVHNYSAVLQKKPQTLERYQPLVYTASALFLLMYIGMETWLGLMTSKYDHLFHNRSDSNRRNYLTLDTTFTISAALFGVFIPMLIVVGTYYFSNLLKNQPDYISHDDFGELMADLQASLLDPLLTLESQEKKDKLSHPEEDIDYLPVSESHLRDLEDAMAEFDDENKEVTEAINITRALETSLINFKQNMVLTNKSFTMYYKPPHTKIKIAEVSSDSDVELGNITQTTSLLRGSRYS